MDAARKYAKAIGGGVSGAIIYLLGIMVGDMSFGDMNTAQWLGTLLAFLGGAGVVAVVRNSQPDVLARLHEGRVVAGEGAQQTTGEVLRPNTSVDQLVPSDNALT